MNALKQILDSKKFVFAIFSMAVLALNRKLGLDLDVKTEAMFAGIAISAIGGQALADIGKEKARVENPKP